MMLLLIIQRWDYDKWLFSKIAQNLANAILAWHKNLNFKHATHIIVGQVIREQKQRISVWRGRKPVFLDYQLLTAIWPENVIVWYFYGNISSILVFYDQNYGYTA